MRSIRQLIPAFAMLLSLVAPSAARAGEVPCTKIVTEVNHLVTRHVAPDMSDIAKKLDTKIVWVEACLKAYGRRYRRPGFESDGGRDEVTGGYEAGNAEGIESKDLEDPELIERR